MTPVHPSLSLSHSLIHTQEGEAFLESHGMKVTDDDVKTRGQKEKLDEITSTQEESSDETKKPKMPREGTMAVTAKVCVICLNSCLLDSSTYR